MDGRTDRQTDGRTDGRTDGQNSYISIRVSELARDNEVSVAACL